MDNSRDEFIKEREERYAGKISFISFAKFIGSSKESIIYNLNGLIYVIDSRIYFEDFEKPPSPLVIYNNKNYKKFELNFEFQNIDNIVSVKEKDSISFIKSSNDFNLYNNKANFLDKFFNKYVSMILSKDNISYYFDITDIKKLNLLTS